MTSTVLASVAPMPALSTAHWYTKTYDFDLTKIEPIAIEPPPATPPKKDKKKRVKNALEKAASQKKAARMLKTSLSQ